MIPVVDFCGLKVSRLIIGGNPFSGFSHQSRERDQAMLNYYTTERIKETLRRAEAVGINSAILRSDAFIHRMLREYRNEGGAIQWIAQVGADNGLDGAMRSIDVAVSAGARAAYIHGGFIDQVFADRNSELLTRWMDRIRWHGIPAGAAGHSPEAHLWVDSLGVADFQAIPFYNCGSLHDGKGDRFDRDDPPRAVEAIRTIQKPCIGYKILGAGRVDPRRGFEYAFGNIKPGDVVNVGMYRGDREEMVEENAAIVADTLGSRRPVDQTAGYPVGAAAAG
ncbi:MAG TPA: hypothetical protein VFJ58_01715 [Armatimonadota bacterium]|nr:hypothetical protein [Armatimonadota bacterium]